MRATVDEEFSRFYRATVGPLTGFLISQGASVTVAADIAQDTMTLAYSKWMDIRLPKAWVHTTASRALARRIANTREAPVEDVPEPTSLLPTPDALLEWELRQDTLRWLTTLPPRQRQVVAWTLAGFTPAEIARELGLTSEAVRANLLKGRRRAAQFVQPRKDNQ
ncbi:RNA polymerase sigma factor [Embleya sp. NPDC059237]|uniref:RNA polymerase sigma factor n=1 Tax=Embleya sp. NPDC059237 TaxID=3346784 RepID=UPI0036C0D871